MACGFVFNNNKWDPLLIHTDADGCIYQGQTNCPQVQIIDLMSGAVDEIGSPVVSIIPNPASSYIFIHAPVSSAYSIYNLNSQKIASGIVDDADIDISHLSAGFYIVRIVDSSGHVYNRKFQKLWSAFKNSPTKIEIY